MTLIVLDQGWFIFKELKIQMKTARREIMTEKLSISELKETELRFGAIHKNQFFLNTANCTSAVPPILPVSIIFFYCLSLLTFTFTLWKMQDKIQTGIQLDLKSPRGAKHFTITKTDQDTLRYNK